MNRNLIIALVVVALVLVGGYFLLAGNMSDDSNVDNNQNNVANNQTNTNTNGQNNGGNTMQGTVTPKQHEIMYTDAGYSPSELKVKAGETVVFKNQSSGQVWTASAMHPAHATYGGTTLQQHCPDTDNNDFDQCSAAAPGASWSFTFTKKGTWGYHNHVKASHFGRVVVE